MQLKSKTVLDQCQSMPLQTPPDMPRSIRLTSGWGVPHPHTGMRIGRLYRAPLPPWVSDVQNSALPDTSPQQRQEIRINSITHLTCHSGDRYRLGGKWVGVHSREDGQNRILTHALAGNNPRFPQTTAVPSTTKLAYRLTGTTDAAGLPGTNPKRVPHQRKQHHVLAPTTRTAA